MQDPKANLRSILQLNFELKQVKQTKVDKGFEDQLQQTFAGDIELQVPQENLVIQVDQFDQLLGEDKFKFRNEEA